MFAYRLGPAAADGGARLFLRRGDITTFVGDAIVNAANERMLGGGGVDGAIHRAAGPELLEACLQVPTVVLGERNVRCPRGEARITPGNFGDLQVQCIIHTVGPIFHSHEESAPLLKSAWSSSLALAQQHNLSKIAFPAISCGVYGYPVSNAAEMALEACVEASRQADSVIEQVCVYLFSAADLETWKQVADEKLEALGEVEDDEDDDEEEEEEEEQGSS